jgi:EF hand
MRIRTLWLAPALLAALGFVGVTAADPGDTKGGAGKSRDKGGRGAAFQPGPGGRGQDGGGRGGPRDGFGPGPGGRGGFSPVQRALDDLNLSGTKLDKAESAVKDYQDDVRKLTDLARSDLLVKMQDVLSEQEFKKFKEAADRGPDFGGPGGRGGRGGRGLTVDQIVERIMSFDKNKDGKITKDELPERMQFLIEKGDTNKDGALDKDEIKKLAADLARDGGFPGFDDRGGPGGRGPGGFGGRGGFPGPGGPGGNFTRAVDDLNLSGTKKEKAEAAVKALQENVRKVTDLARAGLVLKMKDILSEQELKKFTDALDRQPGPGGRGGPDGRTAQTGGSARSEEFEKKIDQLQKDFQKQLDDLKRELRR